jgi:hypothetical protein
MSSLFRASPETEALVRRLRLARENNEDRISYEELSRLANTDVQADRGYGFMFTARKRVQDEDGDVWACERGRGLYLVPHEERARIGEVSAKKVGRQVRRDTKVLKTTDVAALKSTADHDAFNISAARLLVMGAAASRKVGNRLKAKIEEVRGITDLSLNKALDIMKGAHPNRANPRPEEPEEPEGNPRPAP